ncbi:M23 family metallopeptidase [Paraglaciecola hydrolytica]|uniref:Peptidase n=1 Tax=Paraglaciecola hydrolytica TaxID=1799789 RepID=A0A148KMG5_9ALTE|nr:M23 family metallopeptidase [Paraglaciecola hydrolytica]KXI27487.1 peptidase [Paraglaciecola hydrolytica]
MLKFLSAMLLLVWPLSGLAAELTMQGELTQGSLIRGSLIGGSQLKLNNKPIALSSNGHFAFGFNRDAELKNTLSWLDEKGKQHSKDLVISSREYDIQRIEGVEGKYVSPPPEVTKRIQQDNAQIGKARQNNDQRIDFMQDFIWPAQGPISGVYGSQRVFNGTPKNPHYGVDVAGPTGTPVYAPADGIVTLYVSDMYYSGGTMIIDHGMGVSSTFLHLSAATVEQGTVVKQGQLVAKIGATGRVTGAHLDWRINWFGERLDPALLVPKR